MNPVLDEILKTRKVLSPSGELYDLHSEIAPNEGQFIQKLILEHKPVQTLEVGLAFGISSLYICDVLEKRPDRRHIIIDPYQQIEWKGIGLHNLKRAGHIENIEFYDKLSMVILPKLLEKGLKIDFALIDGSHMFENVLVDYYFIDQMLRVGGVIVFDDLDWPAVRKVCRFIMRNSHYRVIGTSEPAAIGLSWKWKFVNIFKNSFPCFAERIFKPEIIKTDAELGLHGSCVAFQKESNKRDWKNFYDF